MFPTRQECFLMIALLVFSFISDVLLLNKMKSNRPLKVDKKHGKVKPPSYRIINGIKAKFSDYPFMAGLLFNGSHVCGGSVISETAILTAAHCCIDDDYIPQDVKWMTVSVGSSKWKEGSKFNVSKCIPHEDYNPSLIINDIALLIMKCKITNVDKVKPVEFASQAVGEGTKPISATVLGWGYTSDSPEIMEKSAPNEFLMADIYSIPLRECRKIFGTMDWDEIQDSQICFTSPDRRGACIGDSGGPLVLQRDSKLIQIGVVSYRAAGCKMSFPEVYTRIDAFHSWIKKKMSNERKQKSKQRNLT